MPLLLLLFLMFRLLLKLLATGNVVVVLVIGCIDFDGAVAPNSLGKEGFALFSALIASNSACFI
jgi:hypothetical protein